MAVSSSRFLHVSCFTEHWTEMESENEPPCKRKRLAKERKQSEPDLVTGDGERLVGAPNGSLSFHCCERRFLLSGGSLCSPYLS